MARNRYASAVDEEAASLTGSCVLSPASVNDGHLGEQAGLEYRLGLETVVERLGAQGEDIGDGCADHHADDQGDGGGTSHPRCHRHHLLGRRHHNHAAPGELGIDRELVPQHGEGAQLPDRLGLLLEQRPQLRALLLDGVQLLEGGERLGDVVELEADLTGALGVGGGQLGL